MDTQEPEGKRLTLADVVDRAIREKGYESRKAYLVDAIDRDILSNSSSALSNWIKDPLKLKPSILKRLTDDLGISVDELISIYGSDPFEPDSEAISQTENPFEALLEWYVDFRTGKTISEYLKGKGGELFDSSRVIRAHLSKGSLSLFHIKAIVDDLKIPQNHVDAIYGRNPFDPPISEFKNTPNPIGNFLDWQIDFKTGKTRHSYLNKFEGELFKKANVGDPWFNGSNPFPLYALNRITEDLGFPLEGLIQLLGRNPFEPDIDKFKKSEYPIKELLDFYIELKTGKTRISYLKNYITNQKIKAKDHMHWFYDIKNFPLLYLKQITEDLQIPIKYMVQLLGRNPFEPDIDKFKKSEYPLSNLISFYVNLRTGEKLKTYLKDKEGILFDNDVNTAYNWIRGSYPMPVKVLKRIVDDLDIPLEELISAVGKNPFVKNMDDINESATRLGALIKFYIDLNNGQSTAVYLQNALTRGVIDNISSAKNWINGTNPFPLFYLKKITNDLEIPLDELIAVNGRDPFKPDIDGLKESGNPIGGMINHYIDLRTGKSKKTYLEGKKGLIIDSVVATINWINGKSPFPLFYLNRIVEDLKIPLEELIAVNGRDPFKPNIEELRNGSNPIGGLIDHYIDLRSGKTREVYLKEKQISILETKDARNCRYWINGKSPFPLFYLNRIVEDLKIPLEELIAVNGRDPFKPNIEELRNGSNPIGGLIDHYIDLKTGKSRQAYLKSITNKVIESLIAADGWIAGRSPFPLFYLKKITNDLEIPLDELIAVNGRDPFKPDIEVLKDGVNPIGGLIDHYLNLRTGVSRQRYFKKNVDIVESVSTGNSWISGVSSFPPHSLKLIVDDLQIPYSEINQFLDYDISDPLEVIVRTKNTTPQQIIQSAFESMQIPTDPHSLYKLVSSLGGDAETGASELVDVLYLACPWQIGALIKMKIGRQEVIKDFIKPHLLSDSGKSSGSGSGDLPPFLNITRVIPYESYQKEAALRSHLVDMALRSYMALPYEVTMQRINAQLASQPDNKVLQHVLLEAKDYLTKMNSMSGRIITVGN